MSNAKRDENHVPTLTAVSNVDGISIVAVYADPVTHRLLVSASSGGLTGFETPVGAVDGSNTTFTVSNTPAMLYVDGIARLQGFDFTYLAGTIVMNLPPQIWIRSLY